MLKTIVTILFVCSSGFLVRAEQKQEWKLWYKQPARQWMEATPLGNGRLGAMIFGGIKRQSNCRIIPITEDWIKLSYNI